MGLIYFQPSRVRSVPEILHIAPTSVATLTLGEPVARDGGDPELIAAHAGGATVTGIVGTALSPVTSGAMPFGDTVMVAMANTTDLWIGQIYDVSASAVATAAVGTHEGVEYGMVEAGGRWYVDEEDTSDKVLRVIKVLPQLNAVLFRWLESAIEAT
jgi:hypothetical protein